MGRFLLRPDRQAESKKQKNSQQYLSACPSTYVLRAQAHLAPIFLPQSRRPTVPEGVTGHGPRLPVKGDWCPAHSRKAPSAASWNSSNKNEALFHGGSAHASRAQQ